MKYMIKYIIIIILLLIIFIISNNIILRENFIVKTWTPYIVDNEYQPSYSNYFYKNGYMYPIF
jgi:hypothetical protein